MPIKLIELEREEAKKEAIKLAKEASRKAKAVLKKKSSVKGTFSNPNSNKNDINDLQEDIEVSKIKVKDSNTVSKGVTTTASIKAENARSVVNSMKSISSNSTKNHLSKITVSTQGESEMFNSSNPSVNNGQVVSIYN